MPALARAYPPGYVPGRPTETPLYPIVRDHLAEFLEHAGASYGAPLPHYVVDELRGYLACGLFERGFIRCHCDACGHDLLVAFSCVFDEAPVEGGDVEVDVEIEAAAEALHEGDGATLDAARTKAERGEDLFDEHRRQSREDVGAKGGEGADLEG